MGKEKKTEKKKNKRRTKGGKKHKKKKKRNRKKKITNFTSGPLFGMSKFGPLFKNFLVWPFHQ